MLREEAKSCICTIKMLQKLAYNIHGVMDMVDADNCKKIIKALEQEPCEDAISRQDTLKTIIKHLGISSEEYLLQAEEAIYKVVKNMPSVTPQQKVGKWIRIDKDKLKCSECEVIHYIAQYPQSANINYCPNCGTKMEEEEC